MGTESPAVRATVVFGLRTFGAVPLPVRADLEYDPSDPYAIAVGYHAGPGVVRWLFGRDLLADGLLAPAGDGDVRVRPAADDSRVIVELNAPDGSAVLEAPASELADFLDRTYDEVPAGEEAHWFDFDHELSKLAMHD
ncbi:SsgA family sporulation/cell division regulator [Amycolatopsis sp. PS_44_ISF1]|uniref:SsgA family sporulation/cell division regulator n=1 Tax=Amycolatopsis sp. PS_44_ISF1 TaxID=2974917 RepID=UPI0028DDBC97|nr:SsgA family sporulation/cell division regulator [Amycolatopsis sp. PS_44_ISF1]MDT8913806.1 SsgA family sporulation/cell division regulator [Amycolatopsis sp. PS_44_ISF1]